MPTINEVNDIEPIIRYTGTNGQDTYVYPFPIFDERDIVVDIDGIVLTLNVDYTVTGVTEDNGGTIVLTTPTSGGEAIVLYRDTPIDRLTDYVENGDFLADTVNNDFDRIILMIQELKDGANGISRALRVGPDDNTLSENLIIPGVNDRSNKVLGFDATGRAIATEGGGGGTFANPYVDIRDYGAVANDVNVNNATAILAAIAAASNQNKAVLVYGGPYYCNNFTINTPCKITGGGTITPQAVADDEMALITITADDCELDRLVFDSEGSNVFPLLVESNGNKINNILGLNFVGQVTGSTSASVVLVTGNNNTIKNIIARDYENGTQANASIPRVLTISSGGSSNTASNIFGYNIAAGFVHGSGENNAIMNFHFDNSSDLSEMRNGIYALNGCVGLSASNGVIHSCSQPIVDIGIGDTYKSIVEIDSGADGVQSPCQGVIFDSITKYFLDDTYQNGGFIRTRAGNNGLSVEGLTVKNCTVNVPNKYSSIFTFDEGSVNNLKVENNTFITRHTDDAVLFSNVILHDSGENPQYQNNTFTIVNEATPFVSDRFYLIRIPNDKTDGIWNNNELKSDSDNAFLRVIGALDNNGFAVIGDAFARADVGSAYLQSTTGSRTLFGVAPPNSGAWNVGDVIKNVNIDLTPPLGFEFQKYLYFVCTQAGDFENPPAPVFTSAVDLTGGAVIGQIDTPIVDVPTEGQQFAGSSVSITTSAFSATGGITHASTNWEVADDPAFSNIVFSSLADAVNLTTINATGLPNPSQIYIRAQYIGNGGELSNYSATRNVEMTGSPVVDDSVGELTSYTEINVATTQLFRTGYVSNDKSLVFLGAGAGQLWRSQDKVTFSQVTNPLNSTQVIRTTAGAADGSRLIITNIGTPYYSTNLTAGSPTWTATTGIDFTGTTNPEVFGTCDSTGNNVWLVIANEVLDPSIGYNIVYRSTDGGVTANQISQTSTAAGGVECIHVASSDTNYVFMGTKGSGISPGVMFVSSNGGATFNVVNLPGLPSGQDIYCICSSPDGQIIYVGARAGRIYKSTDFGATFTQILIGLVSTNIRSCAMSTDGKMIAFGVQTGEYIRSFDSGVSFSVGNLYTERFECASINLTNNLMYMGSTSGKLFKSEL